MGPGDRWFKSPRPDHSFRINDLYRSRVTPLLVVPNLYLEDARSHCGEHRIFGKTNITERYRNMLCPGIRARIHVCVRGATNVHNMAFFVHRCYIGLGGLYGHCQS